MTSRSLGCKSSSSVKPLPPPKKLPYDRTPEEMEKIVNAEVKAFFQKKPPPLEKTPIEAAAEVSLVKNLTRP
jgi:hypothetical protein